MKIVAKITLGFLLVFLFSGDAFAQQDFYKNAEESFLDGKYFTAIQEYKKAYVQVKKFETKAYIIFKTAECYRLVGDVAQSEAWYFKSIKANYSNPKAVFYLAESKRAQGKYDEALIEYKIYIEQAPEDPRGEAGVKSSELAKKWTENPSRYKVENVTLLNTIDREFSPSYVDRKYNKLYFTSTRPGVNGTEYDATIGELYSDVFESKVDKKGIWSTPVALPEPINTEANEGLTTTPRKGQALFFTRCVPEYNKIKYNQIWTAPRKGNQWGDPVKMEFCNDTNRFASPSVSSDGLTLFFSSDLPGGQGEMDIWVVKFDKKEKVWGAPVNLGSEVNTAGNDVFPFIHDDKTLYFSSNGHLGMGGLDIFKVESKGEDKWGDVTNMNYPINSASDDFGIIFESATERGYLTSSREGTKGSDDIWSFILPPLLFAIEGEILGEKGEPIPGVTVKMVGSDGTSVEVQTDEKGVYRFGNEYVKENTSYELSTFVGSDVITPQARNSYVNTAKRWTQTTVGEKESKIFKGHNFTLKAIDIEIEFPAVLYEVGKATLTAQAQDSLLFLYETLLANPNFVIELSAHTDSRGSHGANDKLSRDRAQACFDFLVSKGIPAARMIPKGYGERRLLVSNRTINSYKTEEEKEAGHQKNRRTVFTVLRKDYVDPNAPKPGAAPTSVAPSAGE